MFELVYIYWKKFIWKMKILAAMKMFVCGEITAEEVKEMFNRKSVEAAEPAMLEGGNPLACL